MLEKYLIIFFFLFISACNTVTGTVEGTALGVVKDVKTTYHYSTCIFTKVTCGDLDLDWSIFDLTASLFCACYLYS